MAEGNEKVQVQHLVAVISYHEADTNPGLRVREHCQTMAQPHPAPTVSLGAIAALISRCNLATFVPRQHTTLLRAAICSMINGSEVSRELHFRVATMPCILTALVKTLKPRLMAALTALRAGEEPFTADEDTITLSVEYLQSLMKTQKAFVLGHFEGEDAADTVLTIEVSGLMMPSSKNGLAAMRFDATQAMMVGLAGYEPVQDVDSFNARAKHILGESGAWVAIQAQYPALATPDGFDALKDRISRRFWVAIDKLNQATHPNYPRVVEVRLTTLVDPEFMQDARTCHRNKENRVFISDIESANELLALCGSDITLDNHGRIVAAAAIAAQPQQLPVEPVVEQPQQQQLPVEPIVEQSEPLLQSAEPIVEPSGEPDVPGLITPERTDALPRVDPVWPENMLDGMVLTSEMVDDIFALCGDDIPDAKRARRDS